MEARTTTTTTTATTMAKVIALALCGLLAVCLAFAGAPEAYAASAKKPAKAGIASVTSPAASTLTVKAKKVKRAKGYQYRISTNKKSTKGVKTKTTTKRTAIFNGLTPGKKYYVKVRAYAKSGKKKVYGAWSAVKAVTVKKAEQETKADEEDANVTTQQVATVKTRDFGSFNIVLYPEQAPVTVANFTKLANEGFYDGLTFHRMVSGFALQGGDPNGDGTGGSGTNIIDEFASSGTAYPLSRQFQRGIVAMANSGAANSASSQFFVTLSSSTSTTTSLNGKYAAFGYVDSEGMKIVDGIVNACSAVVTGDKSIIADRANQPVIESIRVQEVTVTTPLAAA